MDDAPHDLDELGEAIKHAIEGEVPATFVSVSQPIEDRVNQLLAGSRADVVIKVFGDDLKTLKAVADEIGERRPRRPGPRRLARAARARPPDARGEPGPEAPGPLRHVDRAAAQVVEASRVGRFAARSSKDRGAST